MITVISLSNFKFCIVIGKLHKVHLETPASQGIVNTTFTYHYDAHKSLQRIENSNGRIEYFTWENGKIVKSDIMEAGVNTFIKDYQYNTEGNINQVAIFE